MKNFKTPKGTAGYSNLVTPDTKFNAEGVYKTLITLTEEQMEDLIELAKEEALTGLGAKRAAKAAMPFKENDDGTYTMTLKSKKPPKLYDSKGNVIKNPAKLRVGSGSTIIVQGAFASYEGFGGGVCAYLNGVQIVKLVEFGGGGFEATGDDDGYEADTSELEPAADAPKGAPIADVDDSDIPF